MKVLIAPDKFKDSLSSDRVASAIEEGLLSFSSSLTCKQAPLADGGEGTCAILTKASEGTFRQVRVEDPLGRIINASYGVDKTATRAFIEMARASGLSLLHENERNPMLTSSRGTGQILFDAMSDVSDIMLGIGGTATHDGGMGIAHALGIRFLDASDEVLAPIGANLIKVASVRMDDADPRIRKVSITVLNDVANPLCGPDGAAYTFARQKGASQKEIQMLDDGLRHFATVLNEKFGRPVDFAGAGAGGGVSLVLSGIFQASFESGIGTVMNILGFDELVQSCDVVITGEGSLDRQTKQGKVVSGVAATCRRYGKPLYVIAGKNKLTGKELGELGVNGVFALSELGTSVETMRNAYGAIRSCVTRHAGELLKL